MKKFLALFFLCATATFAQTSQNGRIMEGALVTRPVACGNADVFIANDSDPPQSFVCGSSNNWQTFGGGGGSTPGGSDTQLQFNRLGTLGASSGLSVDNSTTPTLITIALKMNVLANAAFKGPNPSTDATMYGARSLGAAPSITATISAGSTNATVPISASFVNGDGVDIAGAGATNTLSTPGACTLTPSVSAAPIGAYKSNAAPSGSTSFQYQIVARTKGKGYTPAGTACTTTTGNTLGSQSVSLSTYTRSGQAVTFVTSTAHGLVTGSHVFIQNASDTRFNGEFLVASSADNLHFVVNTDASVLGGAPTSGFGGTVTWFNDNHLSWTAVPGAWQYYIYGRTSGGMALIGATRPGEVQWEDFGATMSGGISLPSYLPSTPPLAGTNDDLVTTILSGVGTTTLVLNNAAINSVTSATLIKDDAPNFSAAAVASVSNATASRFRIPFGTGSYILNSILDLSTLSNFLNTLQCGSVTANETVIMNNNQTWDGSCAVPAQGQSFPWRGGALFTVGTAYPGIYYSNSGGASIDHVTMTVPKQGLGIQIQGTNHFNYTLANSNITVGTAAADYTGLGFVYYGTANNQFSNTLIAMSSPTTFASTSAPAVLGTNNDATGNGPGSIFADYCFFTTRAFAVVSINSIGGGVPFELRNCYTQGNAQPIITFATQGRQNFVSIYSLTTDTASSPTVAALSSSTSTLFLQDVGPPGSLWPVITGAGFGSVRIESGASAQASSPNLPGPTYGQNTGMIKTSVIGMNPPSPYNTTNASSNKYAETEVTDFFHFPAQHQAYWDLACAPTVTATAAAGGTVAAGTYYYQVACIGAGGGESAVSAPSAFGCVLSGGNGTCNVSWTSIEGATAYNVYRCATTDCSGTVNAVSGGTGLTTLSVSDTSNAMNGNYAPSFVSGSGYSGMGYGKIWAPASGYAFTSPIGANNVSFTGSFAMPLTANRTYTWPDVSSTVCVQATGCGSVSATAWSSLTASSNSNSGTFASTAGTYDFSAVTLFKLRVGTGLTTSANGDCGFDTTNSNWHCWNGADAFMGLFASAPTTGHLVSSTVASSKITLADSGIVAANVVNASSPGVGIAHFAGGTQTVTSGAVSLTADVTGTLPIASGGTGATTANGAFNNLSPMTTEGDIIYYASGVATRLGVGTNNQCIVSNGTDPGWASCPGGGGTITGSGANTQGTFWTGTSAISGNANWTYAAASGHSLIQGANAADAYYMKRATDVTPTGNYMHAQNFAANTDVWKVDVNGNETLLGQIQTGTGASTHFLQIPEGASAGCLASNDTISADATTHTAQICNNNIGFFSIATFNSVSPTVHGVLVMNSTYPEISVTGAGTAGQCFVSNGAFADPSFQGCVGTVLLNNILAATATNTIGSGDFAQKWNWQKTSNSTNAMEFSESAAGSATSSSLVAIDTLATSTLFPLTVTAGGTANGVQMSTAGLLAAIGSGGINATQCTSLTCSTTGTGTANTIPKYTTASNIGNSLLSDNATTLTYTGAGGLAMTTANAFLRIVEGTAPSGVASSDLLWADSATHAFKFIANNGTAQVMPAAQTCTNQVLVLTDQAATASNCKTLTSAYVNNSIALTGTDINTSNQVTATHIASATTNTVMKASATGNMVNTALVDNATLITSSEQLDMTTVPITTDCVNDTTTGTTINLLAKPTSTGCIKIATTDTNTPVYIVQSGAGTSSNAQLVQSGGQGDCVMDTTVASNARGYFIIASTTTAGDCHPQAALPSGGFIIGQLISNATTSGSTAKVLVFSSFNPATGSSLTNTHIFVGNASNVATDVAMSGDATMANTGALTVAANAIGTSKIANNAITSAKMAVANTYRTCDIPVGDTSGGAITNGQLGPQSRICFIPANSTIVEMDVNADAGTPNVIVGRNHAGTIANIVSAALATAASGGIACSNTGGTTGINGATTCSATLQNTSLIAGDYLELVSGTAGGTAKFFVVHVTYTIN